MNKRILFTLALSLVNTALMAHRPENDALINAVKRHDVAGVQAALDKGAEVNVRDLHDNTPLHLVLSKPIAPVSKQIITLLIRKGALVDLRNDQGQSPADIARTMPHFEDIQELLGVGACPICLEAVNPADDFVRGDELFDCNPRHIAHRTCLFDDAGHRLTVICPICRKTRDAVAAHRQREALTFHYLVQLGTVGAFAQQFAEQAAIEAAASIDNDAQLIEAIRIGNFAQVQTLLAQGADVNARDVNGITALVHAAQNDRTAITITLLAHPGIEVNAHDSRDSTALMAAAERGHTQTVAALLAHHDIDVNAHDGFGNTALMLAAYRGYTQTVTTLLAHPGIDANAHDSVGLTALMQAAHSGYTQIATALLAHPGIEVNALDSTGLSALTYAAQNEHMDIVTALLTHADIDVNAHIAGGNTTLMFAARYGRTPLIKALLAQPATDVHVHNNVGRTALSMAREYGYANIVCMLIEHGAQQ